VSELEILMEAAAEVAQAAGRAALAGFRRGIEVDVKSDGSPVTAADRAAERVAREWIAGRFPRDGIVGEEFGTERPDARRRWIIDPIDGTRTFVRGVPFWGTLVAVCEGSDILAGASFFPALDELLVAAPRCGCWWNGARTQVSRVSRIEESLVLTTDEQFSAAPDRRDGWNRLASLAGLVRTWGDCYGYLLVATGRAEAMTDGKLTDWDAAALYPAIIEAGGVFTDWNGASTAFGGSAIATNSAVASDVRRLLAPVPEVGA
jgi:histidinol-phosphatase